MVAEVDFLAEETRERVVDEVFIALSIELVELMFGIPNIVKDTHECLQPRIVQFYTGSSAEAALFTVASDAEKAVEVENIVLDRRCRTVLHDFQHRFKGRREKLVRHDSTLRIRRTDGGGYLDLR